MKDDKTRKQVVLDYSAPGSTPLAIAKARGDVLFYRYKGVIYERLNDFMEAALIDGVTFPGPDGLPLKTIVRVDSGYVVYGPAYGVLARTSDRGEALNVFLQEPLLS